jgi:polysaccharide deacetylase 2 family uncharacterized protein YibQ
LKLSILIQALKGFFGKPEKEKKEEASGNVVTKINALSDDGTDGAKNLVENLAAAETTFNEKNVASGGDNTWRQKKLLNLILLCLLSVTILVTLGVITGWVIVNSKKTIREREELKPQLIVNILSEEEGALRNSSTQKNKSEKGTRNKEKSVNNEVEKSSQTKNKDPMLGIIFPHIVEETKDGPLPIISPDGRQSWIEYSRNFKQSDRKPRIAIIISNLGLSSTYTAAALKMMPKNVTFSFSHIAPKLKNWVRQARQQGNEVLIDLPMEPIGFPENDPGRDTLLTSLSEVENLDRLERIMMKAGGFVGLLGTHGNKFLLNSESLLPILKSIKNRGLLYVDNRSTSRSLGTELASSIQLPRAFNNSFIDKVPSKNHIRNRLKELENIAQQKRFSVAIAQPLPISLELLSRWINKLKAKGIALAPISAVADKQSQR